MTNGKPDSITILGIPHKIVYVDEAIDPDSIEPAVGHIDNWKRVIRVYDKDKGVEDVWECIIHKLLHGIASLLHLDYLDQCEDNDLDLLALALTDTLFRNDLIKLPGRNNP